MASHHPQQSFCKSIAPEVGKCLAPESIQDPFKQNPGIPHRPALHKKVQDTIKDQIEHFDRIGLDLGYHYDKGAIMSHAEPQVPNQTVSTYQPSIAPGVRFPHFWVRQDGKKMSSHAWLSPNRFTLLCNAQGQAWWEQHKEQLAPQLSAMIQVINVEEALKAQPENAPEKSYFPIDSVPVLLIRPDGQVAWQPKRLDIDPSSVFQHLISLS